MATIISLLIQHAFASDLTMVSKEISEKPSLWNVILLSLPIAALFGLGFLHFRSKDANIRATIFGVLGVLTIPAAMFYSLSPGERVISIVAAIFLFTAPQLSKEE